MTIEPNSNFLREYHVFLSSPSDVEAERSEVRRFFDSFNATVAARWSVRFTVVDWENYVSIGVGRPQEIITRQTLERFKDSLVLVIGIMAQRFGSATGTHESGTEEEFEWALKSNIETGFPELKWFFKDIGVFEAPKDLPSIMIAAKQWERVVAFRERLKNGDPKVLHGTYTDIADFREKLRRDLYLWLLNEGRPWIEHDLESKIASEPPLSDLASRYYERLEEKFKSLDIRGIDLDRAVDIALSDVYIRLRVIRDEDVEPTDESADIAELDIHDALNSYKRLVVVGDPGSGKSTFLKFIALTLAQARLGNNPSIALEKLGLQEPLPTPLFVSLWDLSDYIKQKGRTDDDTLLEFVHSQLGDKNVPISSLESLLTRGSCCLLFDGLDEVPTESGRALISRLVEGFVKKFDRNRYVVTSRVRGYTGGAILRNQFVRCDIQDFDEADRTEFLHNWFAAVHGLSKAESGDDSTPAHAEMISLRNSIESKDRIRSLAVNPLLMTVIAIVHGNRKRLPDQRVELYDECVDVLLGQRKLAERNSNGRVAELLDESRQEAEYFDRSWTRKRFGEIAFLILKGGENEEITRHSVIELLTPRFTDRGAETPEKATFQAGMFLDDQELKSGLLVSRGSQSCRFVHLTFQEYLAAWNLANKEFEVIVENIKDELRNPTWFETLQLLGGELAKHSDEKLDQYISYLLANLGTRIAEQAPLIALCANILKDVRGVASIAKGTVRQYKAALRGTLHAFKRDSGISPMTQLEVLDALAQLGASVKEHLIQATQSSHYTVRSRALDILIRHLNDDELFAMTNIFHDRSQETIAVYYKALFDRDAVRAKELLLHRKHLGEKEIKGVWLIYWGYQALFSPDEIAQIVIKGIRHFTLFNAPFTKLVDAIGRRPPYASTLVNTIFDFLEDSTDNWAIQRAMTLLAYGFGAVLKVANRITELALDSTNKDLQSAALYAIRRKPEIFLGSWESILSIFADHTDKFIRLHALEALPKARHEEYKDYIFQVAFEHPDENFRRSILRTLKNLRFGFRSDDLLLLDPSEGVYGYRDPQVPISNEWVERCAEALSEDPFEVRKRFEQLARTLPIKLDWESPLNISANSQV